MHNLAIALHQQGLEVTGSDDEIFEPSRSRLDRLGLMSDRLGWNPWRIHAGLSAVIFGMHARLDNPELKRAQELGIPVYSYPSYFYERTKGKTRVVIGGSHGKTTITSMIVHVLRHAGVEFDYLVGAQLEGFDCMVKLSERSTVAIIEGDEYLASALQPVPKFHLYRPDIALISGIAWDHINVFKTFESYVDQFCLFIDVTRAGWQAGLLPRRCRGAPHIRSAGGEGTTHRLRGTQAPHRERHHRAGDALGRCALAGLRAAQPAEHGRRAPCLPPAGHR